jgi:hypothetical protein
LFYGRDAADWFRNTCEGEDEVRDSMFEDYPEVLAVPLLHEADST